MRIALERGGARVLVEPSVGGAIAGFAWRGRDVLRPAPEGATNPLLMSCFPLVPFANRIAYGRFSWHGHAVTLRPNFGDEPHAIHGQGWQSAWRIEGRDDARAMLVFDHESDEWPWAYRARLTYSLDGEGALRAALSLTNRGADPMPASLGFHPYFPRSRRTRLTALVAEMWETDKAQIPVTLAKPVLDFGKGAVLDYVPFVDNCFTGWQEPVLIDRPDADLTVAVHADARFLQIYLPVGADYFCTEPVTAMPDAVHRSESPAGTGLLSLAPGATYTLSMTIAPGEKAA